MKIENDYDTIEIDENKTQFLLFSLGGNETYGINIQYVSEIREKMDITTAPMLPSYIKGFVSIRGSIISIIDLAKKFILKESKEGNRMIVVKAENVVYAIDVYDVHRIVSLEKEDTLFPYEKFGKISHACISHIIKLKEDKLVSVVDPLKMVDIESIKKLEEFV